MKHRSTYYILLLSLFVFCSCNSIDENNRFLDYDPPPFVDKTLPLEESTGCMFSICPVGAEKATDVQQNYYAILIVVEIHAGVTSMNSPLNATSHEVY